MERDDRRSYRRSNLFNQDEVGKSTFLVMSRGERHLSGARPCGEGFYALVAHHDKHTHLAFVLELPEEIGEVQANQSACLSYS